MISGQAPGTDAVRRALPRTSLAFVVALTAVVTACSDGTVVIRGAGSIVQERRELRPVDEIVLSGELDVIVRLVAASHAATGGKSEAVVWIEGASDLIDHVRTIMHGSSLHVDYRDGVRLDPLPTIEIQCSRLRVLTAQGTGTVRISDLGIGLRPGETCEIEARGTVDIRASGEVESLVLRQMGAADLHFADVIAGTVDHGSVGNGDAWIHATDHVSTSIVGATDLFVTGTATVEESVAGSGQVHR